ncbi:MAG: hypothetical protein A2660_00470 [Candidatus Doudnabacteria bacterium RIFCSPHIGHO2_01_FULL_45_18]|uniref:Cell division protein FtsL n=1 Tax=Candidatus Doudnabacteria bacterium RIFCSPHIGHO2_01_FULL_45_18 TaxID=1817823 RepID=A0A1F5NQE9_9BACT|nr:MAG: hypothetical protein A2660_00470 [Candidatus Doudnabacteria bacterium RIFCSPHIGHO2_01_FULL_45_18]
MRNLTLVFAGNPTIRKTNVVGSTYRWNIAILAAILLIGVLYFFTVNSLGTKGYAIRKLEQQILVLEESQKNLQMQATESQSINRIKANAQKLNFVPATNVAYLKDFDFALK